MSSALFSTSLQVNSCVMRFKKLHLGVIWCPFTLPRSHFQGLKNYFSSFLGIQSKCWRPLTLQSWPSKKQWLRKLSSVEIKPLSFFYSILQAIVIWDIRSGTKKRGFLCGDQSQWPVFKSVTYTWNNLSLIKLGTYKCTGKFPLAPKDVLFEFLGKDILLVYSRVFEKEVASCWWSCVMWMNIVLVIK